jgi:hypothetical protein
MEVMVIHVTKPRVLQLLLLSNGGSCHVSTVVERLYEEQALIDGQWKTPSIRKPECGGQSSRSMEPPAGATRDVERRLKRHPGT